MVQGTYTAQRPNPDLGWAYELTGAGQVQPLGQSGASGKFTTLGNVATGRSEGQLSLTGRGGDVTLSLTGPEQTGLAPPPDQFDYQITGGTGTFGGATGLGMVTLRLRPSPGGSSVAALTSQRGEFTLTFGGAGQGGQWVALQTAYLQYPIAGYRRLGLGGELGGTGQLTLDPNVCSVDEFGNPGRCTRMAVPAPRDVTIRPVEKADPSGAGRRLYLIDGAALDRPLYLVTPPTAGGSYRLVYGAAGSSPAFVVTLEALVPPKGLPPGVVPPSGGVAVDDQKGSKGTTFSGTSRRGNIEEALQAALAAAVRSAGHADALVEWSLKSITGRQGSIAGLNETLVTIEAVVK
jgi:hypothetical protein